MNPKTKLTLKGKLLQYENELTALVGAAVRLTATITGQPQDVQSTDIDIPIIVSQTLGIPYLRLTGKDRKREVCEARFIGYKLIKETDPTVSYEKIGLQFGGRDHSSVIHGMNMAEDLLEWDRIFREKYDRCNRVLKAIIN